MIQTKILANKYFKYVQSNQKMHDLYATMHISEMSLPDAFRAE